MVGSLSTTSTSIALHNLISKQCNLAYNTKALDMEFKRKIHKFSSIKLNLMNTHFHMCIFYLFAIFKIAFEISHVY